MAITRIDCHLYRGQRAAGDVSSYVALSPVLRPANLVFAGSAAAREGLGSQVAYRLALDYFTVGVHESYRASATTERGVPAKTGEGDQAVTTLQDAFRSANSSVYSFGHKLAAGGRMAASLVGVIIEGETIAAGRAGVGSVYLYRGDQLMPFFDSPPGADKIGDAAEFPDSEDARKLSFIGANSLVDVELASVDLCEGDILCVFSRPLTELNENLLVEVLDEARVSTDTSQRLSVWGDKQFADRVCREIFTEPETLSFSMVACVGPNSIFCGSPLSEQRAIDSDARPRL